MNNNTIFMLLLPSRCQNTFNACKDICLNPFLGEPLVPSSSFFDFRITNRSILQIYTYIMSKLLKSSLLLQ